MASKQLTDETFFQREDKDMSLQGLSVIESGLATTKSENAGELPTYPGISSPEPSSVSTRSVRDRTDASIF